MKKIYLSGNNKDKFALIDDEDFELVSPYKWYLHEKGYAVTSKHIRMHRLIMGFPKDQQVDHIHRDKLDNRKTQLRICDNRQNHYNMDLRKDNKSGSTGVCWNKLCQKYEAYIKTPDRKVHLGTFVRLEDAIKARRVAVLELHGRFANI